MEIISRRLEQLDNNSRGMQAMIEERLPAMQQQVQQREGPIYHQENHLLENEVLQQPIHHPRLEVGALIPRSIKLEFPRFSGGDPFAWIFRAVQFFRYYEIPEEEKILNASYHLDDEPLVWFQDCERSLDSWETFVRAIQVRFELSSYDDPMETLTKLRHTTIVFAYKSQFEISYRIKNLPESHKINCFLNGLRMRLD